MTALFRLAGTILILAAIAGFGLEVVNAIEAERYEFIPLGEVWAKLDPSSLIGMQDGLLSGWPWLWRTIVLPALLAPVWVAPLVVGLFFRLIGRKRRPRVQGQPSASMRRLMGALQNVDIVALRRQMKTAAAPAKAATKTVPVRAAGHAGAAPIIKASPLPAASPVRRTAASPVAGPSAPRRSGPTVTR